MERRESRDQGRGSEGLVYAWAENFRVVCEIPESSQWRSNGSSSVVDSESLPEA